MRPEALMTGLVFGESPRWHDGRLWVADWGARELVALAPDGKKEVVVRFPFPSFQRFVSTGCMMVGCSSSPRGTAFFCERVPTDR